MNWDERFKSEGLDPVLRADGPQAALVASSDELAYLDERRSQRIPLSKINKINIDSKGLLTIQVGGKDALSVSVQGFQATDLKHFFEGLKPLVSEAKQKAVQSAQAAQSASKPAPKPRPVRPAPQDQPRPQPAPKSADPEPEASEEASEPMRSSLQAESRGLIGRFKLLSLLIVLVGAVFGGLQYTDDPKALIQAAWMFVSSIFLALVVLVLSEVLRVLIDQQERKP